MMGNIEEIGLLKMDFLGLKKSDDTERCGAVGQRGMQREHQHLGNTDG